MKTSSPGASSTPANSPPIIVVSAPATRALAMSPEYCRPPSAMTGTPAGRAADAALHRVHAGVDQRLGAGAGGDVAADDVDAVVAAEVLPDPGDHVEHRALVAVRGVDRDDVDTGVDEQADALVGVLAHADRRGDDQPAVGVLGGVRELVALDEVLDRDQAAEA